MSPGNISNATLVEPPDLLTIVMLTPVSAAPAVRFTVLSLLLATYAAATGGNLLVLAAVTRDRRLHKPVYILVAALAATDVVAASVFIPRLLANIASSDLVSLPECVAQMSLLHLSIRTQGYVLALMAIDRYTAVVQPLRYGGLASARVALAAVAAVVVLAAAIVVANVALVARLDYRCRRGGGETPALVIRNPFCDFLGIVGTSCGDVSAHVAVSYVVTFLTVVLPAIVIATAYCLVFAECRRAAALRGALGKAVATCSTHLIVVAVFYTAILLSFANALALSAPALHGARYAVQVFLCAVPFVLNPVVYGVRMVEIKRGIVKLCTARGLPPRVAATTTTTAAAER